MSTKISFFMLTVFYSSDYNSILYDFYQKEQIENQDTVRFKDVPIDYDLKYDVEYLDKYMKILNQNAVTYRISHTLSKKNRHLFFLLMRS